MTGSASNKPQTVKMTGNKPNFWKTRQSTGKTWAKAASKPTSPIAAPAARPSQTASVNQAAQGLPKRSWNSRPLSPVVVDSVRVSIQVEAPEMPRSSAPVFSPRDRTEPSPRSSYQGPEKLGANRFPTRPRLSADHLTVNGRQKAYHIPGFRERPKPRSERSSCGTYHSRHSGSGPTPQDMALAKKLLAQMQVLDETRKLDVTSYKLRKINAALRMEVQDLKHEVRVSADIQEQQATIIATLRAQLRAQDQMIQGLYKENGNLLKQSVALRESEDRLLRDSCAAIIDLRPSMDGFDSKESSIEGELDLAKIGLPKSLSELQLF